MNRWTLVPIFSVVCPWLIMVRGLQILADRGTRRRRGWGRLLALGLVAAGVLAVPAGGISVAGWLRGVNVNFSIPLVGLVAVAIWEAEFDGKLLARGDWAAGWLFGAVAGICLYPLALGWGPLEPYLWFDPYVWGWSFSPLFVASAAVTVGLLWKQNGFGVLLLLAILAYDLRLLESTNYWDYLVDPVYCLTSIVAIVWRLRARGRLVAETEGQPKPSGGATPG
jgi:hypothetical protein